ncbi:MAG: hypothetical protein IPQ15_15355 [Betaproteobacteria bacterium]|nr:hypothetical protein [Betaproteobacteria bacterium]MBL0291973.1 hypothetical protein [Betaproteobacteria bacterium]
MKMVAWLTRTAVGTRTAAVALTVMLAVALAGFAGSASAQKVVQPKGGSPGEWRLIGQTHADHAADHDTIIVKGPFDNFRKIKFKVTDAPLNMQHMVVTYDNGAPDKIDIRQNIPQGGESRVIDMRGVGKRSIRKIDFWYDTKGFLKGKADVTVFGMK